MTPTDMVSRELTLQFIPPDNDTQNPLISAVLSWTPADPYAVTLAIFNGTVDVEWVVARNLLASVFDLASSPGSYVGDGDIQLRLSDDGRDTQLDLISPSGHARFLLATAEVARFLVKTWGVSPEGAESAWVTVPNPEWFGAAT